MPRAAKRTQVNISQPTGAVGQLEMRISFLWPIIMGSSVWSSFRFSDRRRVYTMDKFENLQTSSESKQHYIPMEVTLETIKDFCINPADVVWTRIGKKPKKVIMIPVSEEQYYEYMRPLWRDDKRQQRQEPMASLDKMYEENEYETADTSDLEADVMKQIMIDELYKTLDELEEIDRTIMEMYSTNHSEAEIGQAVGMSQRGVGKRKQRILLKLRTHLQDYK